MYIMWLRTFYLFLLSSETQCTIQHVYKHRQEKGRFQSTSFFSSPIFPRPKRKTHHVVLVAHVNKYRSIRSVLVVEHISTNGYYTIPFYLYLFLAL